MNFSEKLNQINDLINTNYLFEKTKSCISMELLKLSEECPQIPEENYPGTLKRNAKDILYCDDNDKKFIKSHIDIMVLEIRHYTE